MRRRQPPTPRPAPRSTRTAPSHPASASPSPSPVERPTARAGRALTGLTLAVVALAGCSGSDDVEATPSVSPTTAAASATPSSEASPTSTLSGPTTAPAVSVRSTVASGLEVPWGLAFLPDGAALVAERDSGRVLRVQAGRRATPVGTVAGVSSGGEGGLLGLAIPPESATGGRLTVFAYFTADDDNRIVSMPYANGRLGSPTTVLTGIPAGGRHNGGRLAVGPDGKLYVGTGEAGDEPLSQDRDNLGGKILRINLDGSTPPDNPFGDSPVWSWGHRNVQGLAFDSTGQLWALEFGQNRFDELNRIQRGGNYGWPEVEGMGTDGGRYVAPAVVWPTSDASPSGLAIVDDVAYVAGLAGERLWQVTLTGGPGEPVARFTDEYGRIRTVEPAPGGGLWMTTSNRDGRGDPADDDDRIFELRLG